MRWFLCFLLLLACCGAGRAQEDGMTFQDLLEMGEEWARENLDEDLVRAFDEADQEKVQKFLRDFQTRFQGEYVIELAPLRQAAKVVLPLLEAHEETGPYAEWLRARLDYLEAAEEFRILIPPPKPEPGQPPKPAPNPTPEQERRVWQTQLEKKPAPKTSPPHVARLKPVFAAQKIPAELVWVAEVESGFAPRARSPVGAVGLYQLMPATARQLGLNLSPSDERLDPDKNAHAAAKYLRYLYGRFQDWPLALAAYNVGEGRVQRLLERSKARSFDAIAPRLPAETQMYVPRIDATLKRREGLTLSQLPAPQA